MREPIANPVIVQRFAGRAFENFANDFFRCLLGQCSVFRVVLRSLNRKANFPRFLSVCLLGGFFQPLSGRAGVAANPVRRFLPFPE